MNGTNQNQSLGKSELCYYFIRLMIFDMIPIRHTHKGDGSTVSYKSSKIQLKSSKKKIVHFQIFVCKSSFISTIAECAFMFPL